MRLSRAPPYVLLNSRDGHLFFMENTGSKGGLKINLRKEFGEVFHLPGTGGGNYRYANVFTHVFYKFNVKITIDIVLINTVKELVRCSWNSSRNYWPRKKSGAVYCTFLFLCFQYIL